MTDPVTLHWSPRRHGIIVASQIARSHLGRQVIMTCPKEHERDLREHILQHNGGAWPLGLRIRAT